MNDTKPQTEKCRYIDRARAYSVILCEEFGVPFRFFEGATGDQVGIHAAGEAEAPGPTATRVEVIRVAQGSQIEVVPLPDNHFQLRLAFSEPGERGLVAIGDLP